MDGQLQLQDTVQSLLDRKAPAAISGPGAVLAFSKMSEAKRLAFARQEILNSASAYSRAVVFHDYNCRHPPVVQCPAPSCRGIFTSEKQYCSHSAACVSRCAELSDLGAGQSARSDIATGADLHFARFHLMLRRADGPGRLKEFLSARLKPGDAGLEDLHAKLW